MNKDSKLYQSVAKRLVDARVRVLTRYPFYGSLLMRMQVGMSKCGTAYTDMVRVVFDPEFVDRITEDQLEFVYCHEVLHAALNHCTRGKGLNNYVYNIACDIVVNSNILQSMGKSFFVVDGQKVMHKAPDNTEGYLHSAEEVYAMLMDKYGDLIKNFEDMLEKILKDFGKGFDQHDEWKSIPADSILADEWTAKVIKLASRISPYNLPHGVRQLAADYNRESQLDWKSVLREFVKAISETFDYSFVPPDRRFASADYILPSFSSEDVNTVENLWFVLDVSGSITKEVLSEALGEIRGVTNQFDNIKSRLSFFDDDVTEPVEFDDFEPIKELTPMGGGGTSFYSIFEYLRDHMSDRLPAAVIILTDGFAEYPPQSMALDVPVLWLIYDNEEDAPWGDSIHIKSFNIYDDSVLFP